MNSPHEPSNEPQTVERATPPPQECTLYCLLLLVLLLVVGLVTLLGIALLLLNLLALAAGSSGAT